MRRVLICLVVAALAVNVPSSVSADPTSTCPDGIHLVPVSAVQNGQVKDKNHNGLVCAKCSNGAFKGDLTTDPW
jgi:hypothetical protein